MVLIAEVAQQMGYVPILMMLILSMMGKRQPREYWWLALAFFLSYPADTFSSRMGGSWVPGYIYFPLQVWLISLVFLKTAIDRVFALGALVILAVISYNVTGPGPEVLIRFIGGIFLVIAASGKMAPVIYVYFGLGGLTYLAFVTSSTAQALYPWYIYQACRLLAYTMFTGIAIRSRLGPWRNHALVHH